MPRSARIKCVTTQPGKMTVEYGTTPALGMTSTLEMRDVPDGDVTTHYVILKDLEPNTTYYYRVKVALQGGGEILSGISELKTFRELSRNFPSVRWGSALIGAYGSGRNEEWNASHFDINHAYDEFHPDALQRMHQYNPNAPLTKYDNVTNVMVVLANGIPDNKYTVWQDWCDERNISYEHIAVHLGSDTSYAISGLADDRFLFGWVLDVEDYRAVTQYGYEYYPGSPEKLTNTVGGCWFIGHNERFDIVRITITTSASGGYDGVWEYCSSVDADGWPNGWTALTVLEDTTVVNGQKLAQSGYVRFVPPKMRTEWKRARVPQRTSDKFTHRGYMIRFRVTQSGKPPYVSAVRNDDWAPQFVSGGTTYTTVPGWDSSWEANPAYNGDPEYNPNPPTGKSARFKWWSRLWYYSPIKMRFMTYVGDTYWKLFYEQYWLDYFIPIDSLYDGYYCDNYAAPYLPSVLGGGSFNIIEYGGIYDETLYTLHLGDLMEAISKHMYARGRISVANSFIRLYKYNDKSIFRPEFLPASLAPAVCLYEMATYYYTYITQFEALVAEMDYHSRRGHYGTYAHAYAKGVSNSPNDPTWENWNRDKLIGLAAYLLMKDLDNEWLSFTAWHRNAIYGEFDTVVSPTSPHCYYIEGIPKQKAYYVDAGTRDFGTPITTIPEGAIQLDKAPPGVYYYPNARNVLYRRYTNALVMYRVRFGDTYGDETAQTYPLDGYYYILYHDNTLSAEPVNQISLRNAEAGILIPSSNVQITVSTDRTNPKPLDVVTVTITARNNGSSEARNVRIQHVIPSEATFVQGSLKVNGTSVPDPTDRTKIDVTIPSIPAGGQATVEFRMVIR
ncbi:MAG: hypothetical protein ACUVRT_14600 [Armatimonadota bacterium]